MTWFFSQNLEFPVPHSDISRRGMQRSNHETLSRVPPKSFGPMVNFLENFKNHDFDQFHKQANLRGVPQIQHFFSPIWFISTKYCSLAKLCIGICPKTFYQSKNAFAAKIKDFEILDFGKITNFLDISIYPEGTSLAPPIANFHFESGFRSFD